MKRNNLVIGIVILAAGLIALGSILFYAITVWQTTPQYFAENKQALGKRLYDRVTVYDLDEAYPETPEQVLELYLDILLLQYGQIVVHEDVMRNLVSIQRRLYSDELLVMNPSEDMQYDELVRTTNKLYENKVTLTSTQRSSAVYAINDSGKCVFTVKQANTGYGFTYWEYYMQKDAQGQWKLLGWDLTSEQTMN